ncbi:MAG: alanine dehydrogenase [Thiobacillus sp.]|uniref:alanine dehydrogenase n=1 Tax=unclassified Thiobacillus TaxID=2646513 RepID=UPI000868B61A|nr:MULTISPECIES: alanine dehydrogenase [unclassified Thiobacillus]ODU49269.1 MAG: alanine dehydrogenase [Thiobacillus sp. SCN 63-374]MBN8770006.1 alanine dehydrogenase [Thiobacillus sp.]MBN8780123.1 alanine dehydrogenase [Thiobacillus sp.]ODV01959.1 MAG: alanine dehydrogenase [Thiobacillus sp. SCN 63-57]OJY56213.1 MAG: alanine dehydrogenase [Thiobacillus sp. 0-1251]
MHIGIPKEIKNHEYRVALTPEGVRVLAQAGHRVSVETRAGATVGFDDDAYRAAGAVITDTAAEVYAADLVVKVKEPQTDEVALLRAGQLLFCYLHLAAAPELARELMARGVTAIAYETVSNPAGGLPLLQPMSDIAGRLAPQMGALGLHTSHGGNGKLISGMPGVPPAHVLIIGAGAVGMSAARMAVGLGAQVTLIDRQADRLAHAETLFGARVASRFSSPEAIAAFLAQADIVIGAAQIPGRHAPRLISRELLKQMPSGSVLVDVAIDQGGIAETSRPTTHSAPFFVAEGVVHYCVTNMPGAVARTATDALTHATLPYVQALAAQGLAALDTDAGLKAGLHVHAGQIMHAGLAQDLGLG